MNSVNKLLIFTSLFFANYSLAMEKDRNQSEKSALETPDSQVPLLTESCCKSIADRLVSDLQAGRDYTAWFNLQMIPEELQNNILKALCKYHSDIVWQYLPDSVSVKSLTDNIGNKSHSYSVKISNNGRFVFTPLHHKIWDLKEHKCLFNDEKTRAQAVSCDNKFIAISTVKDNLVKIWDTEESQFLAISFEQKDSHIITAVEISSDNKLIATGSTNGIIEIFDMKTGECLNTIETPDNSDGDTKFIKSIFISTNNKFVITVTYTRIMRIWNLENGECIKTIDMISSFILNSNAKLIITAYAGFCRGTLSIFDATTGNLLFEKEEDCPITSTAIDSKNKLIAFGLANGKAKILNRETNECFTFGNHADSVESIAFSFDAKLVVTASLDNTVKIWDANTGECKNTFEGDSADTLRELSGPSRLNLSGILSVAISQNNDLIVAGLNDGVVKLWKLDTNKSLQTILEEIKKNINHKK